MKVTEAINEFELDWRASGKSLETIRLYKLHLQNLVNYLSDPDIDDIRQGDLKRFMVYLREEHVSNRLNAGLGAIPLNEIMKYIWMPFLLSTL